MNEASKPNRVKLKAICASCLVIFATLYGNAGSAAEQSYDQMIVEARAGEQARILAWFEQNTDRLDAGEYADWLLVANWSGNDRQVTGIWEELPVAMRRQVPLRGQLAAARSYRNLQHWSTSLDIWQHAATCWFA